MSKYLQAAGFGLLFPQFVLSIPLRCSHMVANCDRNCPLLRRMLIAVSALAIGFSLNAAAQTVTSSDNSASGPTYSSSADYRALSTDALLGGSSSFDSDSGSGAIASPQYGGQSHSSYPSYESRLSHIAFEGGLVSASLLERHQLTRLPSRQWRSRAQRGLWLRFQCRRRLELFQALRHPDRVLPSTGRASRATT